MRNRRGNVALGAGIFLVITLFLIFSYGAKYGLRRGRVNDQNQTTPDDVVDPNNSSDPAVPTNSTSPEDPQNSTSPADPTNSTSPDDGGTVPATNSTTILDNLSYVDVFFSRDYNCTDLILASIRGAQKSIYVMVHAFTSEAISTALIEAHNRGVLVYVVMEPYYFSEYSQENRLVEAGIPVFVDDNDGLMYNRVMILDEKIVVTGSFSWVDSDETHLAENLVYISDPDIAKDYIIEYLRIVS